MRGFRLRLTFLLIPKQIRIRSHMRVACAKPQRDSGGKGIFFVGVFKNLETIHVGSPGLNYSIILQLVVSPHAVSECYTQLPSGEGLKRWSTINCFLLER